MVDPLRIRALSDRVREELAALQRLAGLPETDLLSDSDLLAAVKFRFVVVIEAGVDIGRHVVASEGLRAPETYADVFASMEEAGLLAADLAMRMQDAARFRNLLVHQYAEVDDAQVVRILKSRLGDLEEFRRVVAGLASG